MIYKVRKLFIFTPAVIIILAVFALVLFGSYSKKSKDDELMNMAKSYSNEIEAITSSLEDIPNYITFPLGNTTFREEDLKDILKLIVLNDEDIFGTTCAFEPYKYIQDSIYYAPYFFKQNNSISYKDLGNKEYDYFSWNWYLIPKRLGKSFWTEPYFDEGGANINLITYSAPIFKFNDDSTEFIGVITVDMSLEWVNKIVGSIKVKNGGFALLVSKLGTIISTDNKNQKWRLKESIFSLAEEQKWNGFRTIGKKIIAGQNGYDHFTGPSGEKYNIAFTPIMESNWSLLIAVKENKI